MLTGTVDLPTVGPVSKRGLVLGGGAAAAVVGFLWWRRHTAPPPVTDAGDQADATDLGTDTGVFGPSAGPAGGGGAASDLPAGSGYVTNAQWTQEAENALSGTVDAAALSAALGTYITGGTVTAGSPTESLIDQAISVAGYPPVDGLGGYPPAIRTQPASGQTTPTHLPAPATPHTTSVGTSSFGVATSAVAGANQYAWFLDGIGQGYTETPGRSFTGLKSKSTHTVNVMARHNDTYSPHSPDLHVTLK